MQLINRHCREYLPAFVCYILFPFFWLLNYVALSVRAWAAGRTAKLDPALLRDVELVPPHARYMLVRNEDLYAALPSSLPAHVFIIE